jgi:hypothetical protein
MTSTSGLAQKAFPRRSFSFVVDLANPTPEQRAAFRLATDAGSAESGTKKLRIWVLWHGGATVAEIADELGTTPGTVGVAMVRMRKEGWPLPYRVGYSGRGRTLHANASTPEASPNHAPTRGPRC